ncbi:MAG: hypothetical protein HQL51_13425 [Magnetococcales bacterium]|nr:hypothetical protein [Magnetococcales bacterium]
MLRIVHRKPGAARVTGFFVGGHPLLQALRQLPGGEAAPPTFHLYESSTWPNHFVAVAGRACFLTPASPVGPEIWERRTPLIGRPSLRPVPNYTARLYGAAPNPNAELLAILTGVKLAPQRAAIFLEVPVEMVHAWLASPLESHFRFIEPERLLALRRRLGM